MAGLLALALTSGSYNGILRAFIPLVEGFSPVPIWDYSQWSWGYGTAAGYDPNVKPQGTITREKAWIDAKRVIDDNKDYLQRYLNKSLSGNQWAALLSFTYNCGPAAGKKIVDTINAGSTADVVTRMSKYVYANGQYLAGLAARRKKETDLYQGITTYGKMADELPLWIPGAMITDYPY